MNLHLTQGFIEDTNLFVCWTLKLVWIKSEKCVTQIFQLRFLGNKTVTFLKAISQREIKIC